MKTRDIYILGINCFSHNSSACLIKNGAVVFQLEEERFDREKYSPHFPKNAILAGFSKAGISISDVDQITFFIQPWKEVSGNIWHLLKFLPKSLNLLRAPMGGSAELSIFQRLYKCLTLRSEFKKLFPGQKIPRVKFVEHHLAHAASCFFISSFKEAAILIMDGRGESSTVLFARGEDISIKKLHEVKVPHSLGHFYAAMTDFLGFKAFFDEWKVMGMSAYGNPVLADDFRKMFIMKPLGFELDLKYFDFHLYGPSRWLSAEFVKLFGEKRLRDSKLEQKHYDIAKSFQVVVEEVAVKLAIQLRGLTKSENLCMAGGVSLNILMNSEIIKKAGFKNFFIQPMATDSGTSLGSAVYSYHVNFKKPRATVFESPYLGLSYDTAQIQKSLEKNGLQFERIGNSYDKVARLISEGKIVGWYQGEMESGPRSLGNRAILADPRSLAVKDLLNLRIKHREAFRPFAPSVTEEDSHRFFTLPQQISSPYMIVSGVTREDSKNLLPAVTHVDGTARVHTVNKEMNLKFWTLLKEFEKLTDVPVLLNTSFNEQEPIVENPEQAIHCFLRTKMDALCIGEFLCIR